MTQNSQYNICGKYREAVRNKFEETFANTYPWTIYFLIDLRVVYIITFAYITTINLISSTANLHASTDKSKLMLFDVSSEYINVNVTSINDDVLWNCRPLSDTSDYYKFLYWMVITVTLIVLIGYSTTKLITLLMVSNNCGCQCCTCRCSTLKHGLTILWHIAIHQQIVCRLLNEKRNLPRKDALAYDKLLKEPIPNSIVEGINYWKNLCRSVTPYILLLLLVTILCLAFLSFDLHPLACISEPEEESITYEENRVELQFSTNLLILQKVNAILAAVLAIVFVICAKCFFSVTKKIVSDLQKQVEQEFERTSAGEPPATAEQS